MTKKLLTIGICTDEDFKDVWYTVESLLLYHDLTDCEILVLNSRSKYVEPDNHIYNIWANNPIVRVEHVDNIGTSGRKHVFERSKAEFALVIDAHVLLAHGSIEALKTYLKSNRETNNLIQGPIKFNNRYSWEMNRVWKKCQFGEWKISDDKPQEVVEIDFLGLGLFCARCATFAGFNKNFYGWGGEEFYLHEKYRNRGDKCIVIPDLVWVHRFRFPKERASRTPLRRIFENYLHGWAELGKDLTPVVEQFLTMYHADDKAKQTFYNKAKEISQIYHGK